MSKIGKCPNGTRARPGKGANYISIPQSAIYNRAFKNPFAGAGNSGVTLQPGITKKGISLSASKTIGQGLSAPAFAAVANDFCQRPPSVEHLPEGLLDAAAAQAFNELIDEAWAANCECIADPPFRGGQCNCKGYNLNLTWQSWDARTGKPRDAVSATIKVYGEITSVYCDEQIQYPVGCPGCPVPPGTFVTGYKRITAVCRGLYPGTCGALVPRTMVSQTGGDIAMLLSAQVTPIDGNDPCGDPPTHPDLPGIPVLPPNGVSYIPPLPDMSKPYSPPFGLPHAQPPMPHDCNCPKPPNVIQQGVPVTPGLPDVPLPPGLPRWIKDLFSGTLPVPDNLGFWANEYIGYELPRLISSIYKGDPEKRRVEQQCCREIQITLLKMQLQALTNREVIRGDLEIGFGTAAGNAQVRDYQMNKKVDAVYRAVKEAESYVGTKASEVIFDNRKETAYVVSLLNKLKDSVSSAFDSKAILAAIAALAALVTAFQAKTLAATAAQTATLLSQFAGLKVDIAGVNGRLAVIGGKIDALSRTVQNEFSTLSRLLNGIKSDIAAQSNLIKSVKSSVDSMTNRLARIENQLSTLKSDILERLDRLNTDLISRLEIIKTAIDGVKAVADIIAASLELETIEVKKFDSCNSDNEPVYTTESIVSRKVLSSATSNLYARLADIRGFKCLLEKKMEPIAAIPDWWQVRLGADRPQVVFQFAEQSSSYKPPMYALSVPHWNRGKDSEPLLETYEKGNWQGILVLSDNSKLIVNCSTAAEAERVIDALKPGINPAYLTGDPPKIGKRGGSQLAQITVSLKIGKYFPTGQRNLTPEWVRYYDQ